MQLANPFFAQFVIVAKDFAARERLQKKLETVLAEQFPDVVARVSPLELGPPVGWPLQYRIIGPDKDEVRRLSLEFAQILASDARTRHVHYDWMEPARQVRVKVDQDEARRLGVSSRALAAVLNAAVTGTPGDAAARRHLSRQRRGARHRQRARVVRGAVRDAGADAHRDAWSRCGSSRRSPRTRNFRWSGAATACPRSRCARTSAPACCPTRS